MFQGLQKATVGRRAASSRFSFFRSPPQAFAYAPPSSVQLDLLDDAPGIFPPSPTLNQRQNDLGSVNRYCLFNMAPKKKGNKKAQDDWEAELGEDVAPQAPTQEKPAEEANGDANEDDTSGGGGGMMAMLRRNKEKRKKKGIQDDFVEGEDPTADTQPVNEATEATMDDEFALPDKKGKGGKGKQQDKKPAAAAAANDDDDGAEGGRILTKAEKEKLKKEREKQRKKEQV